jgi:N-acetylglucosamine-6-sulfatase
VKHIPQPVVLLGLAVVIAAVLLVLPLSIDRGKGTEPLPPNIVLIVTDDQSFAQMSALPKTQKLIGSNGVQFSNFIVSYPLCCPSRATLFTGEYAHNNGVLGNNPEQDGGGWVSLNHPHRTLASWLQSAGYDTVHFGKWANSYGASRIQPGWRRWSALYGSSTHYYGFEMLGRHRQVRSFGTGVHDYQTDVITDLAARYLRGESARRAPFFLSIGYLAPHSGTGRDDAAGRRCLGVNEEGAPQKFSAVPPPRYATAFDDAELSPPHSFNEPQVGDKPPVQRLPSLTLEQIGRVTLGYGCELAALKAVDDGVERIYRALQQAGQADNTVIVFTSDNGAFHGEHRRRGKNSPYEEAIRVPLMISGPGVPRREVISDPVSNTDLPTTLLDFAGVKVRPSMARPQDGRSLLPLVKGITSWPDRAVLVEGRTETVRAEAGGFLVGSYQGVRTVRYAFTEHYQAVVSTYLEGAQIPLGQGGVVGRELYDLRSDPQELRNRATDPAYADVVQALAESLARLSNCAGAACQVKAEVPVPQTH